MNTLYQLTIRFMVWLWFKYLEPKHEIIVVHDVYDSSTNEVYFHHDICKFLVEYFQGQRPENLKIYHGCISVASEVTPKTASDIHKLQQIKGRIYIVIYPTFWMAVFWVITAISAAYSVYSILTMPKTNAAALGSSNNELANRSNQARLKARIPDIYGELRAYPDLIAQTYTIYENGIEIEECLMALGRGYYRIHDMCDGDTDVANISGTSVSVYDPGESITATAQYQVGDVFNYAPRYVRKSSSINGQTIENPNTSKLETADLYFESPNIIRASNSSLDFTSYFSKSDKIQLVGAVFGTVDQAISGQVVARANQTLLIKSDSYIDDVGSFKAINLSGFSIDVTTDKQVETTDSTGKKVTTTESETTRYDLSGQYVVSSIGFEQLNGMYYYTVTLSSPKSVNYNWNYITTDSNAVTASATFQDSDNEINLDGVYTISTVTAFTSATDQTPALNSTLTLVGASAINDDWDKLKYLSNGSTQGQVVEVRFDAVESRYVGWFDFNDASAEQVILNLFFPNGLFYQSSKGGIYDDQMTVVVEIQHLENDQPVGNIQTEYHTIIASNKSQFGRTLFINLKQKGEFRFRLSRTTATKTDKTQDTCKIKDVYASSNLLKDSYDGVTVIRSKTIATDGALSVKERKLNCLVTRKLAIDGTGERVVTKDAGQALINLALDPHVGRRSTDEVDIPQIKAEIDKIKAYFGSSTAAEFSYTFDDDKLSFEEQAGMIASACFSETIRFGNQLRLKFEAPQDNSVLLFNHRNKVPGSDKRTYKFNIDNDYDGIELEYTSPDDDSRVTYKIPTDGSAKNPQKISTSGIRNDAVAKTRAWREWNKLLYADTACEFDALDESELLQRNDRILIADNTQLDTQDGEVIEVNQLTLSMSQNVEMDNTASYYCYLQLSDGSVDMIPCTVGEYTNQVVLQRLPLKPLVTDADRYVKTLYTVVKAADADTQAFMLTELAPNDQMTNKLTCMNYTDLYYEKDHSFM